MNNYTAPQQQPPAHPPHPPQQWAHPPAPQPYQPYVPYQPQPGMATQGKLENTKKVVYSRPQTGHSIILHVLLGTFCLWINVLYYSVSPNHYWHA